MISPWTDRILPACLVIFATNLAGAQQISVTKSSGSQSQNQVNTADQLPSIKYGNSRRSSGWITTANGTRVGVDDGIEYDGVKVYLSLTWTLVAVDSKTDETLWSQHVSAFWNHMSFEKLSDGDDAGKLVVALRTGRDDETKDYIERYDLKTGKKLESAAAAPEPGGALIKPRRQFSGDRCNLKEPRAVLITSQVDWAELHDEMFNEIATDVPRGDLFDDTKEALLVICSGDATNCRGIRSAGVYSGDEQIVVRLSYQTFQSDGNPPTVQPFGIIVLPKDKLKKYVVQRNRQRYIDGPPIWKQVHEFTIDEPSPN